MNTHVRDNERYLNGLDGDVTINDDLILAEAKSLTFGDELLATTDHTASGIKQAMVANEALVFGDLCYLNGSTKFAKADADVIGTTEGMLALAIATIAQDATGDMLLIGFARDDTWNWTIGADLYVDTTAGAITETVPSGSGDQIRRVGYAVTADVMWFNPDGSILEVP